MSAISRPHTFLFTDLVGFTALTADRGDDGAADVCQDFYSRVRALLDEHKSRRSATASCSAATTPRSRSRSA